VGMCLDCAEGFPELCQLGGCRKTKEEPEALADIMSNTDWFEPEKKAKKSRKGQILDPDRQRDSRRKKNDANLKDPHSTGRKRAVTLHGHADSSQDCEWRGLANCGGGRFPILGCTDGVQENLHHGPDKNTLNNERSNIHKICSQCHNRWHALNDPGYEWDGHHELHSPRKPEEVDLVLDSMRWKTAVPKAKEE
jgi:hypothetical protein